MNYRLHFFYSRYILLLLFCAFSQAVLGQEHGQLEARPILSSKFEGKLNFSGKCLETAEDQTATLSVKEVSNTLRFIASESEKPNFGYTKSSIWGRFRIHNDTKEKQTYWLELDYANMDSITLYEIDNLGGVRRELVMGDKVSFNERKIMVTHPVFPIELSPNERKQFYLHLKTDGTLTLPLILWSPQRFTQKEEQRKFGFGIYYGIMLVMVLYNLFVFLSLKDNTYLYYVVTIMGIALLQLTLNGYGFEYIWTNYPHFNNIAVPLFIALFSASSYTFSWRFLRVRKLLPKYDRLVIGFVLLNLIMMPLSFVLPYKLTIQLTSITGIIGAIFLFFLGVMSYVKGNSSALYFLLAWALFLLGAIAQALRGFGIIGTNFIGLYSMQIGSALEVVFLALGLADRINVLKKVLADKAIGEERLKVENEIAQRYLIETQKQQLEDLISERTRDLAEKTNELEIQNKKMKDSINYAKRIQDAILPPLYEVEACLESTDFFIFFKPRDIVSGDFYWTAHVEGKAIIAAVDCTGHGVPGAFMSIIGHDLLDQVINEQKVTNPTQILEYLDQSVRSLLKQDRDTKDRSRKVSRDGMDVALCVIDRENNTLEFAGAHRPLWVIRNETLEEIKGTPKSIGGKNIRYKGTFDTHQIPLNQFTNFYIASDGYQDQFGQDGKKFLTSNFKKLLVEISPLSFEEQKKSLAKTLQAFQGSAHQIDDIMVVGFKVV